MIQRRNLVDNQHSLSIRKQCDLLSVHRSGIYYAPKGESAEDLEIIRLMDEHYLKHPSEGVLRMQDFLFAMGIVANHKRVRRLLRLMGLMAVYPKKNLSRLGQKKYIHPYLLKGLKIDRPNQVWAIDITYWCARLTALLCAAVTRTYLKYAFICIYAWVCRHMSLSDSDSSCTDEVMKLADKGK